MNNAASGVSGSGRISSGIQPDTLVARTLDFVFRQLPAWRDDTDRPQDDAEYELNHNFCKFLNVAARKSFSMVLFNPEEPQTDRRKVDWSATPTEKIIIEAQPYSIYDPLLVFEGKRLPTPNSGREREYVSGITQRTGGIQRFKLCLHGASLKTAAMIGYIQDRGIQDWHQEINGWISNLVSGNLADDCSWDNKEMLETLDEVSSERIRRCRSTHSRNGSSVSGTIDLHHLWVEMSLTTESG